jgi:predicted DNA-binding transcriptional regulator AlpA
MDEYLTTAQAAEILGIDERTMYYYARDHDDFPEPRRFGRTLMWREAPLRAWREKHPPKKRDASS